MDGGLRRRRLLVRQHADHQEQLLAGRNRHRRRVVTPLGRGVLQGSTPMNLRNTSATLAAGKQRRQQIDDEVRVAVHEKQHGPR